MTRKLEVIPDVLEGSLSEVQKKLDRIRGRFTLMHVDIIDGLFADNITISISDLQELDRGDVELEVHLMADDPHEYIEECVAVGCSSVIAQIEKMSNQGAFIDELHENNIQAGLAVDLYTPVSSIEENVMDRVDSILLMSVKTGFSGQEFNELVVDKIKDLRTKYDGRIVVDGGINDETVELIVGAGADAVAVNSYLWEGNIEDKIRRLYGKRS